MERQDDSQIIGRDSGGSGVGLIGVLSRDLLARTEENHVITQNRRCLGPGTSEYVSRVISRRNVRRIMRT